MQTIYVHSKTNNGRRFTLAGVIDGNMMEVGLAVCSPQDQFCKKIGRIIALGRVTIYNFTPNIVKSIYFKIRNFGMNI